MDEHVVKEILATVNIVDIIGSYIPLKREGSNYKARCPFHEEKTASFVVSENKQIYKCFGCQKAGNAISFIREYEKISFVDAVRKLAEKCGIVIEQESARDKTKKTHIENLYSVNQLAKEFYRDNLNQHGRIALEYLNKREVSNQTIKELELGYALNSYSALHNTLLKQGISQKLIEDSGLITKTDKGIFDLFRDRLIFPILSSYGKVVAFGGRIINEAGQYGGKYVNSPTTEIYTKGRELFGLYSTRNMISKANRVIIVEGYMDFLRMYEKGFNNTVASLGTALTKEQIQLLSRFAKRFSILYDGDKAGCRAAIKAAGLVMQYGYQADIICLPEKEDPDSFLLHYDVNELQNRIAHASSLAYFVYNNESLDMSKLEKINTLIDIARDIEEGIQRQLFIQHISEVFQISEYEIMRKAIPQKENRTTTVMAARDHVHDIEEKNLLTILLEDESVLKKVGETITKDYFFNNTCKILYILLTEKELTKYIGNAAELIENVEDKAVRELVSELIIGEKRDLDIEAIMKSIQLRKYQYDLRQINDLLKQDYDNIELYEEKVLLKKKISSLTKQVVRKTLF